MNRRSFLAAILATACAPAIVRADSLMRIVPHDTILIGIDLADATWSDATVLMRGEIGAWNGVRIYQWEAVARRSLEIQRAAPYSHNKITALLSPETPSPLFGALLSALQDGD